MEMSTVRPARWSALGVALAAAVVVTVMWIASPAAPAGATPSHPAGPAAPAECDPATATDGLLPDGCYGPYPVHNYDINYESGSIWDAGSWGSNFIGLLTQILFDVGTWFVRTAQWSIGWSFTFDIGKYTSVGTEVSAGYERAFITEDKFKLLALAYAILLAYVAFNILRQKAAMALGELVTSVVLVAVSAGLLANLNGYMQGTWKLMDGASAALLVAGQGSGSGLDPAKASKADIERAVRDVQSELHTVFVQQPYDQINWNRDLRNGGSCEAARNQALAEGPHDNDDRPRELMRDAGCDELADFNKDPSTSRLGGAFLSMVASAFVSVVLSGMGLTVVATKFVALLLFAVAPFVGLFAVFPGGGRRWGWLWLTTLVQAVVAVVGMSFLLSTLLITLKRTLGATSDMGLIERFFIVVVLIGLMSQARTRLLAGAQSTAGRFADNLTNVRLGGGGAAWQGPMGSMGPNLAAAGDAYSNLVQATAAGASRTFAQRRREARAWHNIIKARRRGDRMAALVHKTYYSDAPGGSNGPGPRYGYGTLAGAGGAPPIGPGGFGPSELGEDAHAERMGYWGGTKDGPAPIHRANHAEELGWAPEARYWRAIDRARRGYANSSDAKRQKQYDALADKAASRYRKETGATAARYSKPWKETGRVTSDELRTGPVARKRKAPIPPTPERSRRLINEVIVQEQQASGWRFPTRNVTDKFSNWRVRTRGRRWARKRDVL
jgi:hypothetical protein